MASEWVLSPENSHFNVKGEKILIAQMKNSELRLSFLIVEGLRNLVCGVC